MELEFPLKILGVYAGMVISGIFSSLPGIILNGKTIGIDFQVKKLMLYYRLCIL